MEDIKVRRLYKNKKGKIGKVISIYEPNTDYRHDRKSYLIQWDIKRAYYISQIKDVKHSPNIIDLIEERRLCKW